MMAFRMKLQELGAYLTRWISRFGHSGNFSEERLLAPTEN
jgi:hypothetical protein